MYWSFPKKILHQGPVPERCNNPIPGINVPGIKHIYPWNRVITPLRNPAQCLKLRPIQSHLPLKFFPLQLKISGEVANL